MAASRLVMAAPAALLLGVALLAWTSGRLAPTPQAAPPRPAAVAAGTALPSAMALLPTPATPRRTTLAAAPPSPTLATLLAAPGAGLRATVQQALAAPARGGRFYARALTRRCADLAGLQADTTADLNDARHQRAVARQAALATGCGQFAPAEWLGLVNIAPGAAVGDDPLLAVQQSDLDDAALLQAVFARPDPLLLDELGERLLSRRVDGQPTLYFDGQRFDDEAGRDTARAALRLLPCHFGLTCDERDPEVWLACLRGDGCAASRADTAPAAAQALAARLAAAMRAHELRRFLPPPS